MKARTSTIVFVTGMLLAGCGGSEPTQQEWATNVNKICRDARGKTMKVVTQVQKMDLPANEAAARVIEQTTEDTQGQIDRLRDVEAPGELQDGYDRFVSRIGDSLPLYKRLADDLKAGRKDPELTTKLAKLAADTRPFATGHGLRDCLADTR